MKSKSHRATVTGANLHYAGSTSIDRGLSRRANLVPHEKLQVVDVDNGARLETYVMQAEAGSVAVYVNGAAARLVERATSSSSSPMDCSMKKSLVRP